MFDFPHILLLRLALYFFAMAIPTLFAFSVTANAMQKITTSKELIRFGSILAMLLAMVFLMVYARFDGTRYMIFAIIGRAEMLKGFVCMIYPQYITWKIQSLYTKSDVGRVYGIVMLLCTAFLTWVALAKF